MGFLDSVPRDQLYFLSAEFLALTWALLYRLYDDPRLRSVEESSRTRTRALFLLTIPGILLGFLCYGWQMWHIILQGVLAYILILYCTAEWIHYATLGVAMTHLSLLHYDRLIHEYPASLDITAPVMVLVQKVTTVAFGLYDGEYRAKKADCRLTEDQKFHAITQRPTILEFSAYVFNFQTVVCGPLVAYADFVDFVDGNKLRRAGLRQYPSRMIPTLSKLGITAICGVLIVTFVPRYPPTLLLGPAFSLSPFLSKLMLMYWVALAARLKYYFAWTLSEAVGNASGLGFSGVEQGQAKWDLMTNIDIPKFETTFNQRDALQIWNSTTETWLRRVAYDRTPPRYKVATTYALSAVWHGFHPGYYLTFMVGAIFTEAGRTGRQCLRHRFQALSPTFFNFYHLLTFITTRIALSYLVFPFILLEASPAIKVYFDLSFFGHLVAIAMIFGLPLVFPPPPRTQRDGITRGSAKEGAEDGEPSKKSMIANEGGLNQNPGGANQIINPRRNHEIPPRIQESVSEKMSKYGTT